MFVFRCGEETRIIPRILQVKDADVRAQVAGELNIYSVKIAPSAFNINSTHHSHLISKMRDQWYRSDNEIQRLTQGGVSGDVIDSAVTSFILQTIVQHGEAAERLCNKVQLFVLCLGCIF